MRGQNSDTATRRLSIRGVRERVQLKLGCCCCGNCIATPRFSNAEAPLIFCAACSSLEDGGWVMAGIMGGALAGAEVL